MEAAEIEGHRHVEGEDPSLQMIFRCVWCRNHSKSSFSQLLRGSLACLRRGLLERYHGRSHLGRKWQRHGGARGARGLHLVRRLGRDADLGARLRSVLHQEPPHRAALRARGRLCA